MAEQPLMVAETTEALTRLAEHVEACVRGGHAHGVPDDLVEAADRLVSLLVRLPTLPTSRQVVELIWPGEEVTAAILQDRLAALGRPTKPSAIGVALHRAALRGQLERAATGRYRQPSTPATGSPSRTDHQEVQNAEMAMASPPKEAP